MNANPHNLPSAWRVHALPKGRARARAIRTLYGQRCNVEEIAAGLSITADEVRRTLRRPLDVDRSLEFAAGKPRHANGRWARVCA